MLCTFKSIEAEVIKTIILAQIGYCSQLWRPTSEEQLPKLTSLCSLLLMLNISLSSNRYQCYMLLVWFSWELNAWPPHEKSVLYRLTTSVKSSWACNVTWCCPSWHDLRCYSDIKIQTNYQLVNKTLTHVSSPYLAITFPIQDYSLSGRVGRKKKIKGRLPDIRIMWLSLPLLVWSMAPGKCQPSFCGYFQPSSPSCDLGMLGHDLKGTCGLPAGSLLVRIANAAKYAAK